MADGAADADPAAMTVNDAFHETQAETSALDGRRASGIAAVETLEDVRDDLGRHADARVAYLHHGLMTFAGNEHLHLAALGRVLERVVEQVEKTTLQPTAISNHDDRLAGSTQQIELLCSCDRFELLGHAACQCCEIDDIPCERNFTGFRARKRQQLVDEAGESVYLLDLARDASFQFGIGRSAEQT